MLKKRRIHASDHSRNHSWNNKHSLSRLEELAELERELISVIGPKNIEVNLDGDLFSRL